MTRPKISLRPASPNVIGKCEERAKRLLLLQRQFCHNIYFLSVFYPNSPFFQLSQRHTPGHITEHCLLPLFSNFRDTGSHNPGGDPIGVVGADFTAWLACSAYGMGGEFFVDLLIEKLLNQRHILGLCNQEAPFVCFKSLHTVCRKSPQDVVPGRKFTEIPKKGTVRKKQIGRVFHTAWMFLAIVQLSPNLKFFFRKLRFQIFRKQEGESPHIIFVECDGFCFRPIFPMSQPLP